MSNLEKPGAFCTGSDKTGLCISLLEEAALDSIPRPGSTL